MTLDANAGMVSADPSQLHQVVMNLRVNALQAMEGQNGALALTVRQEQVSEQFAALLKSDMAKYAKLIKSANIRIEP